jgi:glycosyltransferase involved in cell wall biosynthesis
MVSRVVALARHVQADALHAHEAKSDVLAYLASRVRRLPIVTTMHGWIGNSARDRLLTSADKRVARYYDRVIAVSKPIHDALADAGVPPRALRLLHNAIVLERYQRTGRTGELARLIGGGYARPVLATIGRISPEKGQADLIEALDMVARQGHQFTAVLAGDGPDRPKLIERVKALGLGNRIFFPGYIDPPQCVLEESDLMVLPSHTEGLPNAALEAMAMEVPVLATHVGGTPEVVDDGETGRLVPPRAPEALAGAIIDFLSKPEPWKALVARARQVVEAKFNFTARTRGLEAIYSELLAQYHR